LEAIDPEACSSPGRPEHATTAEASIATSMGLAAAAGAGIRGGCRRPRDGVTGAAVAAGAAASIVEVRASWGLALWGLGNRGSNAILCVYDDGLSHISTTPHTHSGPDFTNAAAAAAETICGGIARPRAIARASSAPTGPGLPPAPAAASAAGRHCAPDSQPEPLLVRTFAFSHRIRHTCID
jgi:hypothetical protein